jgi:murein DD-endopeptidase MepM/ murein hydrolase activator NlpD
MGLKSASGPSSSWLRSISRERRTALISLMCLTVLLGSLLAYRRFTAGSRMPPDAPAAPLAADAGAPSAPPAQPGPETGKEAAQGVAATETTTAAQPVPVMQPLSGQRTVLQPYELAFSAEYGEYRLHPGVDYQAELGESVLAAAPGRVIAIEDDPADGTVVTLDHGNGMATRYAGLGQVLVGRNASVQAGDILALVGKAPPARSSMPTHLHFEVLLKGEAVDPFIYLSK